MTDFNDAGEATPWKTTQPIPSPQYPLSPRHEVTDEELDALKQKIMSANHFEELAKLKKRIIDSMLN